MKQQKHKRIRTGLLALLLLLSCAGCSAKPTGEATQTTEETEQVTEAPEQEVKQTRFGLAYVPEYGFNPYSCTCLTNRPVISLVYESLFVVNESFAPEPVLCDKFGVSSDGLTYLITLRDDAVFSDGDPVTPQDVVASLRAASNSAYYGDRFRFVKEFSVFDSHTVKISLYTPYETLPLLLDIAICKSGTEHDSKPIGSGPFRFLSNDLYLRRSETWWQGKTPVIEDEYITLKAATQPIEVRDSFEFGSTKMVLADPNSAASVGYRCDYELWNCNTTVMQYLGFNTLRPTLSRSEVRKAFTWLIDRDTVCSRIYKGFAVPASLPCSPACSLYDKTLADRYAYAPEQFTEWRKTSGIPAGTKLELVVWSSDFSRVELANYIADALSPYGIEIVVTSLDFENYKARLKNGNFDLFIGEVRLSNDFDLTEFFAGDGDLNFGAITDGAAYSFALKTLANSGNGYDLYEEIMETGLLCPVLFKSYAVMVTRGYISTLQPAVDNVFHLPGGRTFADAGATYEELAGLETDETEADTDTDTDADTEPQADSSTPAEP